ncbi:Fructosamine kinase-domain-containing protein [Podospora didyma]|uniref:protein-ribulosamine 3-kinase n=1 Tax=Podospora didyma TaxID=330526 RepID=A0AAE0K1G8_9PEZI|nr:Fructosamine kinase-domain-containing protein [Podospora didyma]
MASETLDPATIAALPEEGEVISVTRHGETNWSTGKRVDVRVGDKITSYFLKVITVPEFVGAAQGEYEGQKALSAVIPSHVIAPLAWGYFAQDDTKAWYLTYFRNLRPISMSRPPPLEHLLSTVRNLHDNSVSPTGQFGFHVTPYYGAPPMIVDWTDNWEEFFTRDFRASIVYAQRTHGHIAGLQALADEFFDKVVPRLLRPLQTGGRRIKPSLCHGDLWDGNIQIDAESGEPVIFDPCPFYGHCEMDLQCMRRNRYTVGIGFVQMYGQVAASEPREDFDDRNALYAIRNDIMTAGMYPERLGCLADAKEEMRRLIAKHPEGLSSFGGDLTPTGKVC